MNALILQHVPFEGPGIVAHWLAARGASVGYTRFFESADLPDPAAPDLIVAMGGPMSVNDEAAFPWLVAEKQFIGQAIERGVADPVTARKKARGKAPQAREFNRPTSPAAVRSPGSAHRRRGRAGCPSPAGASPPTAAPGPRGAGRPPGSAGWSTPSASPAPR